MKPSRMMGEFHTPENLVPLIAELAIKIPASQILDPACGSAGLLVSLARVKENAMLTGVDANQGVISKAESLLQNSGAKYRLLNADFFIADLEGDFDLIVCEPPFGMVFEREIDGIKFKSVESAFIFRSLQLLKQGGYAIFVVPEGLLLKQSNRVFRELVSQNYSLQAVISVPSGIFQPYAGMKTSVLIFKNSKQAERVFFAEFAEPQALKVIVSNFNNQTANKNLSQGFWVSFGNIQEADSVWAYRRFRSIKDFEAKQASSKFPVRHLSELVSIGNDKTRNADTILIQRIGNQSKAIMKDELPENSNARNYIELTIVGNEVVPQYLKLYLNSEQGKNQFLSIVSGALFPPLRTRDLENIFVEIPDRETQLKIVEMAQKFAEVSITIQLASQSFYSQLFNYDDLLPLIERLTKADENDVSFENLISPLATSFRISTKGSPNINSQLDSYFKMFEMIAELNSIVLLSALPEGLREQYEKEIWAGQKGKYSKPSFGLWVGLYRRLVNLYKKLKKTDHQSSSDTNTLDDLPFGEDFYANLSSPEVLTKLDIITEMRNQFAHGGIIPETAAQKAVSDLHPLMIRVFEKLSKAYSALYLIYPQSMKKSNGLYKIKVKRLQGTHYPYAEEEFQTETDLNTESLYLFNPVSTARLELLPEFVKLVQCEHCGHWSIYFYSEADSKKAQYICFQNEIHEYDCSPLSGLLCQFVAH